MLRIYLINLIDSNKMVLAIIRQMICMINPWILAVGSIKFWHKKGLSFRHKQRKLGGNKLRSSALQWKPCGPHGEWNTS
jgi:hypothetical protein